MNRTPKAFRSSIPARAKAAGVYKGRRPSVDVAAVRSLREEGFGGSEIAKKLGIGRASVYRALQANHANYGSVEEPPVTNLA